MKRRMDTLGGIALVVFVMLSASFASGQQRHPAPGPVIVEHRIRAQGPEGPPPPPHGDFIFVSSEMSNDGKLVKGAPYSAQAVTESTNTLGDGNRIVHKSTSAIYRDSEGRTRREHSLRAIGAFAADGEQSQTIFISDPVSGNSYALDTRAQTANKMPPLRFKFKMNPGPGAAPAGGPDGPPPPPPGERIEFQREILLDKEGPHGGVVMEWHRTRDGKGKTESLGKQSIEGVEAEGSRSTLTIPAGEIGNERPIEIVSERWYSPELQAVVMTRHSDPRFGETTYRLTNISRTEPARSLFEIPAGYTVKEVQMHAPEPMRIRKRANNPE